jgi:hypothetical protein
MNFAFDVLLGLHDPEVSIGLLPPSPLPVKTDRYGYSILPGLCASCIVVSQLSYDTPLVWCSAKTVGRVILEQAKSFVLSLFVSPSHFINEYDQLYYDVTARCKGQHHGAIMWLGI